MKKVLIVIVVIVVLFLGGGFLISPEVHVERSIEINAPAKVIYNQISDLKNWYNWSPWHNIDPDMIVNYEGPESGQGAAYTWTSNHENVGNGKLTITEANEFSYIKTAMEFQDQGGGTADFILEQSENLTLVKWTMETNMGNNPIARYMGLMMDKWIGEDYEKGLAALKKVSESITPDPDFAFEINEVNMNSMNIVSIKHTCNLSELGEVMNKSYPSMAAFIMSSGGEFAGAGFAIYHHWSVDSIVVETCFPTVNLMKPNKNFQTRVVDSFAAAQIDYYGNYDGSEAAHETMDKWFEWKKLEMLGTAWEIYVTNPNEEPDTTKWLTQIIYPIKPTI